MRNTFSNTLIELAEKDETIILIVGDIGFGVFDQFIKKYPKRFINAGVAEANMIGTAAGLAMSGMKPIVYTIIPFLLMRTFEQIRNDICMQELPVTLVGVGGGLSYGTLGPTHHAIEDIAIMRSLPNMRIVSPCDPNEVNWCFRNVMQSPEPTYFRLGKGGEENLLSEKNLEKNSFTKPLIVSENKNKDVVVISSGYILKEAITLVDIIQSDGIPCSLINLHQIKPENQILADMIEGSKLIITIEEHSVIGGVGDMVNNCINNMNTSFPIIKFGINDKFVRDIGDRDYLLSLEGLTATHIYKKIANKIKNIKS